MAALLLIFCVIQAVVVSAERISSRKCKEYARNQSVPASIVQEFPHVVLLGQIKGNPDSTYTCAGALISDRFILTSRYCANHPYHNSSKYAVVERWNSNNQCDGYHKIKIQDTIPHPSAKKDNIETNDIGLVKLASSVPFSDKIRPACLYNKTPQEEDGSLVDTIWSSDEKKGSIMQKYKTHFSVIPTDKCANIFRINHNVTGINFNDLLCAAVKDTDFEVSAGGFACINDKGKLAIAAINMFGRSRERGKIIDDTPEVYHRISKYLDWIESKV